MRSLSAQLADLSRHAEALENASEAAAGETRERLAARVAQSRSEAERRANELDARGNAAMREVANRWNEIQRRWQEHVRAVRSELQDDKGKLDAARVQRRVEIAEDSAAAAIAFAIAAVEEAQYAVLDAALAQSEAEEMAARA